MHYWKYITVGLFSLVFCSIWIWGVVSVASYQNKPSTTDTDKGISFARSGPLWGIRWMPKSPLQYFVTSLVYLVSLVVLADNFSSLFAVFCSVVVFLIYSFAIYREKTWRRDTLANAAAAILVVCVVITIYRLIAPY